MRISLLSLLNSERETIPISCVCDFSELELWGERPFKNGVKVEGRVENRAGTIKLKAAVNAPYEMLCARCLAPVSGVLLGDIDCEVVPSSFEEDGERLLLTENGELDILEAARAYVLLNMPAKVLCSKDCRGLCPICGKNLNEGGCACQKQNRGPEAGDT